MKELTSFDDILDFAIEEEQKAVEFYTELAGQAFSDEMRAVFEEFAQEEVKHKMKLMEVKETGITNMAPENVADLRIADYIVSVKASPNMSYQEALVVAMNKEKAAFRLYTSLSERATDGKLKELFAALAQEESKHKLRFEIEYDDFVLREN
ncbi:MAG TPA: ferritin family protein [Bacteroidales bacterium]|nr:ferritin family protein [Bacteroidales bacterium]